MNRPLANHPRLSTAKLVLGSIGVDGGAILLAFSSPVKTLDGREPGTADFAPPAMPAFRGGGASPMAAFSVNAGPQIHV
jgi:hypothetical protein